jgi:hypothetical protein
MFIRKRLGLLLLLSLVISPIASLSAATGDIWLSPATASLEPKQDFDLEIRIDSGDKSISVLNLYLDFDASKLKINTTAGADGLSKGTDAEGHLFLANTEDLASGHYRLASICAQDCAKGNDAHVATIHMATLATFISGYADISLRINELADELNVAIPTAEISGTRISVSKQTSGGGTSSGSSGATEASGTDTRDETAPLVSNVQPSGDPASGTKEETFSLGASESVTVQLVNNNEPARALVRLKIKSQAMYTKLKGRIMLKPEDKGKAYYISPIKEEAFFLDRPDDAFAIMREQGNGIKTIDLKRFAYGGDKMSGADTDGDGLPDAFEEAIATDKNKKDSDGDGFDDKTEAFSGYDPMGKGKQAHDSDFAKKHEGKIFLQVEGKGEAWYIYGGKRYYLGRPADAFQIMRNLSLGISNADFDKFLSE